MPASEAERYCNCALSIFSALILLGCTVLYLKQKDVKYSAISDALYSTKIRDLVNAFRIKIMSLSKSNATVQHRA